MKQRLKEAYNQLTMDENKRDEILEILLSEEKSKEKKIVKFGLSNMAKAVACLMLFIAVPLGVTAAVHYLSASQTAESLGSKELAGFYEESDIIASEEDGEYRFLYLGNVTAQLKEAFLSNDEATTYMAVAVERIDSMPLTDDETFVASPLIQGLNPKEYNVYTMGGGATWKNMDGICYMIMAVDSIEMFADRAVYLAVTTGPDYALAYQYDEMTGLITRNETFDGINVLFKMKMDSTKADMEAQKNYVESFGSLDDTDTRMDELSEFEFGSKELDYFYNFPYDSIETLDVERIKNMEGAVRIDSYEFALNDDVYHVKFENQFGSGDGEMAKELFADNTSYLGLWSADEDRVILEYMRRDSSDVLHVNHYLYENEMIGILMEELGKLGK